MNSNKGGGFGTTRVKLLNEVRMIWLIEGELGGWGKMQGGKTRQKMMFVEGERCMVKVCGGDGQVFVVRQSPWRDETLGVQLSGCNGKSGAASRGGVGE